MTVDKGSNLPEIEQNWRTFLLLVSNFLDETVFCALLPTENSVHFYNISLNRCRFNHMYIVHVWYITVFIFCTSSLLLLVCNTAYEDNT